MESMSPRRRRIALGLEVDPGSDPISGRVVAEDGKGQEFVGWLGLGTALDRLTKPEEGQEEGPAVS